VEGDGLTGVHLRKNVFSGLDPENGIRLNGTGAGGVKYCVVEYNEIHGSLNDGIELAGIAQWCTIRNNYIRSCSDNGISLNGANVGYNRVECNVIDGENGDTNTGINIVSGDYNTIVKNAITNCVAQKSDTGSYNNFEGNEGTLESCFLTALDGSEQDVFGSSGSEKIPLNESGTVRLWLNLSNMTTVNGDTVVFRIYQIPSDGASSLLVNSYTYNNLQTNQCAPFEVQYTTKRGIYCTIERTAGTIVDLDIGICESAR
jgi:hypothetical protein